jgi:hypothetical protein
MNIRPYVSLSIFVGVVGIMFAFMFHSEIGFFSVLLGILGLALIIGAIHRVRK